MSKVARRGIGMIFLIPLLWGMMVVTGRIMDWIGWDWYAERAGFAAGYTVAKAYTISGGRDYWTARALVSAFTHPGICAAIWTVSGFICGWAFRRTDKEDGRQDVSEDQEYLAELQGRQ